MQFRAAVWNEYHWVIARCLEVDVATQGGSLDEALENLHEALALHFEKPAGSGGSSFEPPSAAHIHTLEVPNGT